MIAGVMRAGAARVRLKVIGVYGRERIVETVVDTGYNGDLTLPPSIIAHLGLRWRSAEWAEFADGSPYLCQVLVTELDWDGAVRRVLVDQADPEPLIGLRLLKGCELRMQVRSRVKVTIKRLPRTRI